MSADDRRMSIGELAAITSVSTHTLRYYEDEALIPEVERNGAGHRRYREDHVRWIGLLERLRTSGMSIARMQEYVALAVAGDETIDERRALLERHAEDIRARRAELEQCLEIVQAKIALYDGRLDGPGVVWELVADAQAELSDADRSGLRSRP